jgi:hypothetical protein
MPAANRLTQLGVSFRQKSKLVSVSLVICLFAIELMLLLNATTIRRVGAVEAIGVGVYWDSKCTNPVSSINWGTLTPGSAKDVIVYIRNEGNGTIALSMKTKNWDPSSAYTYLNLGWNYMGQPIGIGEVAKITLALSVSEQVSGITSFCFDIIIEAQTYVKIPCDINGDGKVDALDLDTLAKAWGEGITKPFVTSQADFNGDEKVSALDLDIFNKYWGWGVWRP